MVRFHLLIPQEKFKNGIHRRQHNLILNVRHIWRIFGSIVDYDLSRFYPEHMCDKHRIVNRSCWQLNVITRPTLRDLDKSIGVFHNNGGKAPGTPQPEPSRAKIMAEALHQ
ncbi:hypothetical protein E4U44_005740 [Claviceps purpurea]|nr:hypothetical protein E4U44_005740 [Claviceps purpurea]